jgi:hypothetical protein
MRKKHMARLSFILALAGGLLAESDNILPTLILLALAILFYSIAWIKEEFTWEEVTIEIRRKR